MRNLDLTALRSFVMVADTGGVTRAAHTLNLTQSAVSMQLRRLEETFGRQLYERAGRSVKLTPEGEVLVSYARRLVALNDEVWRRMTEAEFDGAISLGVPHDIINPYIPGLLKRFRRDYPRVRVELVISFTEILLQRLEAGEIDAILTTEAGVGDGGVTVAERRLVWAGAAGGSAWSQDPLPLAFERTCAFRKPSFAALDKAGRAWRMITDTQSEAAIHATISADLAIFSQMENTLSPGLAGIGREAGLPELPAFKINYYQSPSMNEAVGAALSRYVREAYSAPAARTLSAVA